MQPARSRAACRIPPSRLPCPPGRRRFRPRPRARYCAPAPALRGNAAQPLPCAAAGRRRLRGRGATGHRPGPAEGKAHRQSLRQTGGKAGVRALASGRCGGRDAEVSRARLARANGVPAPLAQWHRIRPIPLRVNAMQPHPILVGRSVTTPDSGTVHLLPRYGNRHGLVAGATGTGKTVTLMMLAESFSRAGVPVFMADMKGDVAGLAVPGTMNDGLQKRIDLMGIDGFTVEGSPTIFWDLYGKLGHPVRTTVTEMGPTLLARILELNDTQSGVLDIVFKLADDRGLLLLDLDDLRALLALVLEERKAVSAEYGLVAPQSVGA